MAIGPLFSDGIRRGNYRGTVPQDPGDAIRDQRVIARKTQDGDRKARMLVALQEQRARAIAGGVMAASLPAIHGAMSDADLAAAQGQINSQMRARGIAIPGDQPGTDRRGAMVQGAPASNVNASNGVIHSATPNARRGSVVTDPNLMQPAGAPVRNESPKQMPAGAPKMGPKDILAAKKAGKLTPAAARAAVGEYAADKKARMPDTKLAGAGSPERERAMQLDSMRDPAIDAARESMVGSGMLPKGAEISHGPAGWEAVMNSQSGPRSVAFSPTGEAVLAHQFENVARAQYGKGWLQLNPEQRGAILKSGGGTNYLAGGAKSLPPNALRGLETQYGKGYSTDGPSAPPQAPPPAAPPTPAPAPLPAPGADAFVGPVAPKPAAGLAATQVPGTPGATMPAAPTPSPGAPGAGVKFSHFNDLGTAATLAGHDAGVVPTPSFDMSKSPVNAHPGATFDGSRSIGDVVKDASAQIGADTGVAPAPSFDMSRSPAAAQPYEDPRRMAGF